jgi:hypothetical protein
MILVKDSKDGSYRGESLEGVLNNISAYIRYRLPEVTYSESTCLTNALCKDLDLKLKNYYDSLKDTKKLAFELSYYDDIFKFLTEGISEETLNRIKAIDWKKEYDPCSKKSSAQLKNEIRYACIKRNSDELIRILNENFGNCCITSIDQLDDE